MRRGDGKLGTRPRRRTTALISALIVVATLGTCALSVLMMHSHVELRETLSKSVANMREAAETRWVRLSYSEHNSDRSVSQAAMIALGDDDELEHPDSGNESERIYAADAADTPPKAIAGVHDASENMDAGGLNNQQNASEVSEEALGAKGHYFSRRRRRRKALTSDAMADENARLLQAPRHTSERGFETHAVIKPSDNALVRAYSALLARQEALPATSRSYLLVRAESGWGNKVRALIAGFKLALGTGRIMLVDDAFVRPIFPDLFTPPFSPWLASSAVPSRMPHRQTRVASRLRTVGDASADLEAWLTALSDVNATRALVRRNAHGNAEFACWAARHALSSCVDPHLTRVLVLETNQPMSALVMSSTDVRPALAAALGQSADTIIRDPALFDRLIYAAMFGAPRPALVAAVASTKDAMGWSKYKLRIGVHLRLFVDSRVWRMRSSKIRSGWWECAHRMITAMQSARGVSVNETLIVLASDKPSARSEYASRMASWAAVRWVRSVAAFVNSRDNHDVAAVRGVLTEWTVLSDTDAVLGTQGSSFSTAAALRSAIPRVVGSLRSNQCEAESRFSVT